ncbi:MAG TPA: GvpL/GvpF family gas vesicle protein [Candidatus Dormibacteraeota bacterium]|nr:GvpL/GvpF family gas vesicle protein [Candidatus Dormibacteraeota bacterium]
MPVLAYCVAEAACEIHSRLLAGVSGAEIETLEESGLRCFVSSYPLKPPTDPDPVREAALDFHRVLQTILSQAAIIPFRFPTILSDSKELVNFLQENASNYLDVLSRLRNKVQMEVRIAFVDAAKPPAEQQDSGASYLRRKQSRSIDLRSLAQRLRTAAGQHIDWWKERETGDGLQCYALIDRGDIDNCRQSFREVSVPPELTIRITGPWPAGQFVEKE